MISIIMASKDNNDLLRCQKSIEETINVPYELLVTPNADGKLPLTQVYNQGAKKARFDILCYLHEDTEFKKKDWGQKVCSLLSNKDIGAVGVVGSTYFPENGAWGSPGVPFVKGRIIHLSPHIQMDQIDLFSPELGDQEVVTLDGVFMATRKDVVASCPFDEKTFDGFHFYDADFCIRVAQKYKVLVSTDILLKHYSHGKHNEIWNNYRRRFIEKYKEILPFTKKKQKPDWNNIKNWEIKYLLYKKGKTLTP